MVVGNTDTDLKYRHRRSSKTGFKRFVFAQKAPDLKVVS